MPRQQSSDVRAFHHPEIAGDQVFGKADVGHLHHSRVLGPRMEDHAGLERAEGHREIGEHRFPSDQAGVALDAGRDVDRHHGSAPFVHQLDGSGDDALRPAAEPRPEHRVDHHVGTRDGAG